MWKSIAFFVIAISLVKGNLFGPPNADKYQPDDQGSTKFNDMASKVASAIRKSNLNLTNVFNFYETVVANHAPLGAQVDDMQVYDSSLSGFGETEIVGVTGHGKYIKGTLVLKPVTWTGKVNWAGTSKTEETTFTISGLTVKQDINLKIGEKSGITVLYVKGEREDQSGKVNVDVKCAPEIRIPDKTCQQFKKRLPKKVDGIGLPTKVAKAMEVELPKLSLE